MDDREKNNLIKELEALCKTVIQEKQHINHSIEKLEADKIKRDSRRRDILIREMRRALAAYSKVDQNLISEIKVDAFDKNNEAMKIFEESNCLQSALMNQPCNKDIYRHQVALLKERAGRLSLGFFNKNIHLNIQSSQEMFTDIQDKYADAIWHTSSSLHPNQFSLERQILESASDKDIRIQILHHDLNIFHETVTLQRLKLTVTDSKSKSILEDVSLLEKFNKNEVIIDASRASSTIMGRLTIKLKKRQSLTLIHVKLLGSNIQDSPLGVGPSLRPLGNLSMSIVNDSLSPAIFDQSLAIGNGDTDAVPLATAGPATIYEGYEGLDSSDLNSLDLTNRRLLQNNPMSISLRKASQPPNMSTLVEAEESQVNNISSTSTRSKLQMGIKPLLKHLMVQDPPGSACNSPFNPKKSMASTMKGDAVPQLDNTARNDFGEDVLIAEADRKLAIAEETLQEEVSCFVNDRTVAVDEGQSKDEDDDPHLMLNASKAPSPTSANKTIVPDPCWNEDYEPPSKKVFDPNLSALPDNSENRDYTDRTLWEDECVEEPRKFSLAKGKLELVNVLKSKSIAKSSSRGDQKCLRDPHSVALVPSLGVLLVSEPSFNRIGVYSPSDFQFIQWMQTSGKPFKNPSHMLCHEDWLFIIEYDRILFYSLKDSLCVQKGNLKGYFHGLACSPSGDLFSIQETPANTLLVTIRNQKIVQDIVMKRNKPRAVQDETMYLGYTDNHVFVVDSNNHRLFKVNLRSGLVSQTGYLGSNLGQFNNPTGVMVDEEEALLVADSRNNRLNVFSKDLKMVKIMEQTDVPYSNPQHILRSGASKYVFVVYSGGNDQDSQDTAVVKFKLRIDGDISSANSSNEENR